MAPTLRYTLAALLCSLVRGVPNVVFIVADDLGFSDISFQGGPQIPTPHIDALFHGGVALRGYHAQPVCSPTRASMLSGRHVVHTGIYMPFDSGVTNEALDSRFTLLPRYLKAAANYSTHLVGKWHLGANTRAATPVGRGFDTAFGYWSGAEDYQIHSVTAAGGRSIYDMQDDLIADVAANGSFSTAVFAARAEAIIAAQGAAGANAPPLLLYLAWQNVHWPLEAPADYVARFANATGGNPGRALVCAMAAYLDEGVGNVTRSLTAAGLDNNTIVVFVSDSASRGRAYPAASKGARGAHCDPPAPSPHPTHPLDGGPTHNDESTWSNNFPLRGGKNTLWEGGTRVLAAVKGPGIVPGSMLEHPVHATDWLPSLVSMATGGQDFRRFAPPGEPPYEDGDGVDVWATITGTAATPQRDWLLLEAHNDGSPKELTHGNALIEFRANGALKYLLLGPEDPAVEDGWFPPDGEDLTKTNFLLKCSWQGGGPRTGPASVPKLCTQTPCLFNLTADPCEYIDIAAAHPDIVAAMAARLANYTTVPPLVGKGCQPQVVTIAGTHGPALQFYPCDVTPPHAPTALAPSPTAPTSSSTLRRATRPLSQP